MRTIFDKPATSSCAAPVAADARRLTLNGTQQRRRRNESRHLALLLFALGTLLSNAATITWDGGGGDLSWQNPLNWSGDQLPGAADDAVINVPTNVTIVCDATVTVRSVQCQGGLRISSGYGGTYYFTVTGGSSFVDGPFTLTGREQYLRGQGSNVVFVARGPTVMQGRLEASSGAAIVLTNSTSLVASDIVMYIYAMNGGLVDLSGVTNVAVSWSLEITASGGGRVDLRRTRTIDCVSARAAGVGSVIDLSGLSGEWGPVKLSSFEARDDGAILIPNVTGLTNVNLTLGGTNGTPIGLLRSFRRGSLTVETVAPDFGSLTNVDGSSLSARFGGTLNLSKVTALANCSYVGALEGASVLLTNLTSLVVSNDNLNLTANYSGAPLGGLVDLSRVTNVVVASGWNLYVRAYGGGRVNLPQARITGNCVEAIAEGAGSVVDFSGLSGEWGTSYRSLLGLSAGGTILIPNVTGLRNVDLNLNGATATPLAQLRSIRQGQLRVTTIAPDLSGVTNVDGSTLVADQGATLNLCNVRVVAEWSDVNVDRGGSILLTNVTSLVVTNRDMYLCAGYINGGGGLVDLSRVTNLVVCPTWPLQVRAYTGGRVNLQGVESITGYRASFVADGAGSVIDLSRLSGFVTPLSSSSLTAQNGGVILINDDAVFLLANVAVTLPGLILQATPAMVLHAQPWHSYWVEQRDARWADRPWQFLARVPMTNTFQTFAPAPPPNAAFRVWEFVADPPIIDLWQIGPAQTQVVLYGATNRSYQLEWTPNVNAGVVWQPEAVAEMTNAFRLFPPAAATDDQRFFRAKQL